MVSSDVVLKARTSPPLLTAMDHAATVRLSSIDRLRRASIARS
jgi:hypothetical protein